MKKYSYLSHNWLVHKKDILYFKKYKKYLNGKVYDLGCGTAPYKEEIVSGGNTYIGADWSNTFHNSKNDIQVDLNKKFMIDDEVADSIMSLSVLEHLSEPQNMLNEAYRILKKDGYIILQVPFQWWIHEAPYDHFRYTPYGLKYMLGKAGFKEIKIEATGGLFTTITMKINYFLMKFTQIKVLGKIIRALLIPYLFVSQIIAPILDKLDRHWDLEAPGYYVVAKKVLKLN